MADVNQSDRSVFGEASVLAREIALRAEVYGTAAKDAPWGVAFRTSVGSTLKAKATTSVEARNRLAHQLDAWANNYGRAL